MSQRRNSDGEWELTGYHVLIGFLVLFGLFAAANAYFITAALTTHSGVVARDSYRKGLKYNERIAASNAQEALGWSHNLELSTDRTALEFELRSGDGSITSGLDVIAQLSRPATDREDQSFKLTDLGSGRYSAPLGTQLSGAYIVDIEAADPSRSQDTIVYRARKRLWVKP